MLLLARVLLRLGEEELLLLVQRLLHRRELGLHLELVLRDELQLLRLCSNDPLALSKLAVTDDVAAPL